MVNERTYQQQIVEERLLDNWEKTVKYNDDLDRRTTVITSASTIVVGIVAAGKFLPDHSKALSVESVLLGLVCLASVVMYWFATQVWGASLKAMPGSHDVNELYEQYIAKSEDEAYNNSLIDLAYALRGCVYENARKSNLVDNVVKTFQVQLALLALAIAWTGIAAMFNALAG